MNSARLLQYVKRVPDPRRRDGRRDGRREGRREGRRNGRRHPHMAMLVIVFAARLCNIDGDSGNGNNATYTVVKFVGVRIMDVKLSGGPNSRHLTVQPAVFSDSNALRDDLSVNVDSILSQPVRLR